MKKIISAKTNSLSTSILRSFDGQLSRRIQHFALLKPTPQALVLQSSWSIPLWRTSPSSNRSMLPPNLVLSTNWLRMHSIHLSRSLIRTLNRNGPSTEPETPLVICYQLDEISFTTHLWAQLSSWFFTQWTVHVSKPWAAPLSQRMCAKWYKRLY